MVRRALVLALIGVLLACSAPTLRVHPGLFGEAHPVLPERVVTLALVFDVAEHLGDGAVRPLPSGSERATDHLREALEGHAAAHPRLAVVEVTDPAARARLSERRRELAALVDDVLEPPVDDGRHVTATLGPVLAAWGTEVGAEGLLLARGQNLLPTEVWDRLGGGDDGRTVTPGYLRLTLALIDLPTGDVLWMDVHDENIGDADAVWWPDARARWVSDDFVGELMASLPEAPGGSGQLCLCRLTRAARLPR